MVPDSRRVAVLAQNTIGIRLELCWGAIETVAAKGGVASKIPKNSS
jgi:hypothetical protein